MRPRGTPAVLYCSKEESIVQQSNKTHPSLISMTANFLFSLADTREGIKALKTPHFLKNLCLANAQWATIQNIQCFTRNIL